MTIVTPNCDVNRELYAYHWIQRIQLYYYMLSIENCMFFTVFYVLLMSTFYYSAIMLTQYYTRRISYESYENTSRILYESYVEYTPHHPLK